MEQDDGLYYECARDIIISLIAGYSAAQRAVEHGDPPDAQAAGRHTLQRLYYLAALHDLDQADQAEVIDVIRTHGPTIRELRTQTGGRSLSKPAEFPLNAVERAAIFDQKILPEIVIGTRESNPRAIIVGGAAGSGKSSTIRRLRNDRAGAAGVMIDPDLLAAYHPADWDLIWTGETRTQDAVVEDARSWAMMALDYAIGLQADIFLETAISSVAAINDYATLLGDEGYRVDVHMAVVAEPVRKLHLLLRTQCRQGNWEVLFPSGT
ncbi:zeta toxin family protein [Nocardia sp. NPDC051463]|uniref:zeta toxin family protein n=1 Tax=Nocardia sp. NPDC051463 TaxID=3154845 RepID=UPI00344D26E3